MTQIATKPDVVEEPFSINAKQAEILQAIKSRQYDLILLIGPVGSNKTFGMAYADVCIAYQYDKVLIPVGRTTLSEAMVGTVLSYLEVLDFMGLEQEVDYRFTAGQGQVRIKFFHNGSIIQFVAMDHTKDREWRKIKSINATKTSIDEVDGVKMSGFIMLASRAGRRNRQGAPKCTTATCNPNDGWFKEHYYNKWKNPEKYGELPNNVKIIEFTMQDSFLYKTGYYNMLMTNSPQWQQRFLYNNWDYQDDENSLFKMRVLDNINVETFDSAWTGYSGTDVAREGKDRSVIATMKGNVLIDIKIYTREQLLDLLEPGEDINNPPWAALLGREVIKVAKLHETAYGNSAVDAVGNGGGVVDFLRTKGFFVNEYKSGASPVQASTVSDPDMMTKSEIIQMHVSNQAYANLRSQMFHQLAMDMEKGEFKIWDGCPYQQELKQELLYHGSTTTDKVFHVETKDSIKDRLMKSPDIADAVVMAFYNKKRVPDKRYNTSRLG